MAIAFGSSGASAAGSTSLAVPYPASISAGQLLLLHIVNKYPSNTPDTPAGFALLAQASGGAGSAGADSGTVYSTVYYRYATGTESGNITVNIPSGNAALGRCHRYTSGASTSIELSVSTGSDNAGGVNSFNATSAVDIDVVVNDFVLVAIGVNTDLYTYSADALTISGGLSYAAATNRDNSTTTTGDDIRSRMHEWGAVLTGDSTSTAAYSVTTSANTANTPAGAAVFIRLREVSFVILPELSAVAVNSLSSSASPRRRIRHHPLGYPTPPKGKR